MCICQNGRKEKVFFILRACVHLTDSSQMEEVSNDSDFKRQASQLFLLKAVEHKHFSCPKELRNFICAFKKHSVVVIWRIGPINLTKYIALGKSGQFKCFRSHIKQESSSGSDEIGCENNVHWSKIKTQ